MEAAAPGEVAKPEAPQDEVGTSAGRPPTQKTVRRVSSRLLVAELSQALNGNCARPESLILRSTVAAFLRGALVGGGLKVTIP